ncbi:hypothetical protein K432DRAFT_382163 [Lepidopterella palustris CBS 459.81]|uniref:Uncharacterized protein n=1 Tax=Lepidopterella palustris CBS 459.81 TaxID=1314670 RepID=A0A8E2JFD2_9PEZI|nr:hypothetical protein K432DRAFT_382163 [Lepidopterella palustris CBS 459.81]
MDYVDRLCLGDCWDQLSPELQKNIVTQVAAIVNQLQSIPLVRPGGICGGMSRVICFSDYGAGPFVDRLELGRGLPSYL